MTMTETEFRKEIESLREMIDSINNKIDERMNFLEAWKSETDIGIKGLDDHGILGYRQKIDRNYIKIEALEKAQGRMDRQMTYVRGWLAGAIVVSASVSSIVSWLFINFG